MTFLLLFAALSAGAVDLSVNLQTYYAAANGKAGYNLRAALNGIISPHTTVSYDNLRYLYKYSDTYNAEGLVIEDIYSYCDPDYNTTFCSGNCGYNREHSLPKSWWKTVVDERYSDAFHLYPTNCNVNSYRNNFAFGECAAGKVYSKDGISGKGRLGKSTFVAPNGTSYVSDETVYEPDDAYKGDLARSYFYMVTCYINSNYSQADGGQLMFVYTNNIAELSQYSIDLLLKWHRQDPVSQKELIRNEVIYGNTTYNKGDYAQYNRNPFIDYPCLAEYIWGEHKGEAVNLSQLISAYDPAYTGDGCGGGSVDPPCTPTAPDFTIGNATLALNKGEQDEVWYIYAPEDTPGTITYSSDHPEIASVDEYGMVTAHSAGTARITVHVSETECETAADIYCDVTVHDFHALPATDITANSFTANWTSDKTGEYTLDVYHSTMIENTVLITDTLYFTDFSTDFNAWTVNTISGYESVWNYNSKYHCLYGSSYVNSTRYPAESRIVSPEIDLTEALSAELSLYHAFRFSATVGVQVSTDDGLTWVSLSPTPWATVPSWTFDYSTVDLSDYIGQTIRVALYYEGTSSACPTWEIQSLCVTSTVNQTTYTPQVVPVDSYPKQVSGTSHSVTGLEQASTYYYTVELANGLLSGPIEVTTKEGCQATITILSNDENLGTVEFVK